MLFKFEYLALLSLGLGAHAIPLSTPNEVQVAKRGAALNAFLNYLLSYLPAINTTITDATSIITGLDNILADLTGAQETYNELGGTCREYTVIFARGTAEPGNVSMQISPRVDQPNIQLSLGWGPRRTTVVRRIGRQIWLLCADYSGSE